MKSLRIVLIIICLFLLCSCRDQFEEQVKRDLIIVNLEGKVKFPGVYELNEPLTLRMLIKSAGGLLNSADVDAIDYDMLINRSMTIVIPELNENEEDTSLININKATKAELMTLPRIGEAMAQKIIDYRKSHGDFKKIEDIMNVQGIKEAIFAQIKDYITV